MDLKRQELRRLLAAQQGRSPPQPLGMLPHFYLSPPAGRRGAGIARRSPGDLRGWEDTGNGPNARFQSPGRPCSVPGPAHRNCNTDYLFMERPLRAGWQRSGFTAGSRSGRAAASLAALPPAQSIPSGSSQSIGALFWFCCFGWGFFLVFFLISLGLLEMLESSPGARWVHPPGSLRHRDACAGPRACKYR